MQNMTILNYALDGGAAANAGLNASIITTSVIAAGTPVELPVGTTNWTQHGGIYALDNQVIEVIASAEPDVTDPPRTPMSLGISF
jgi:hypothetical protein